MNFEYYYGTQADQFSFIRIPRILLLDEAFSALSLSAKVLYSVLLDRMGLSMKNKWLPTLEKCEHKNSFINILLYKSQFVSLKIIPQKQFTGKMAEKNRNRMKISENLSAYQRKM